MNYSVAAKILGLTLPAVSVQIKKLEENLGLPILEKNRQKDIFTLIAVAAGTSPIQPKLEKQHQLNGHANPFVETEFQSLLCVMLQVSAYAGHALQVDDDLIH